MDKDKREEALITWLKDAYAMEVGIVESLERQMGQYDDMPDAKSKIRQHIELTKDQAERVKDCVEQLGGKVAHAKSALASVLGALEGISTKGAKDQALKHALGNFAIEHFEIASYWSIASAARELGHEGIAQTCEQIIREEEEMARWVEQQIPVITTMELQEAARD
jgi:ferritin-like metal-binding protein YciE